MRCGLGVVEVTQGASRIQQNGGGCGVSLLKISVLFGCSNITLLTRRRRNYREPDHAPAGPFTLQPLHVSAVVVLLSVRAAAVCPFQYHKFALVFGKLMDLTICICCCEVRRRRAHSRSPPERWRHQSESDYCECNKTLSHSAMPPCLLLTPAIIERFLHIHSVALAYCEATGAEISKARPGPKTIRPFRVLIGSVNWSDFFSMRRNPL